MLRKIYVALTALFLAGTTAFAQSGGAIKGKVVDKATKEGVPFANVIATLNGVMAGGAQTDLNGEFTIKPLAPGKYNVKASYVGYQPQEIQGVVVSDAKTTYLMQPPLALSAGVEVEVVEVVSFKEPLIDPDTKSGGTVTREEFLAMPSKNINSVAATTAGVYQGDEGGALSVRGQRSDGTAYFIDGQRVIGSASLPQQSIEQVSVITGGVPAQYGDAAGGVINITTRGPQSEYFGGVELITSEVLDSYGYNFVGFSVGGPIWLQKDTASGMKIPRLGFILSGEGVSERDPDPSAIGTYKIKDEKLREIEETPLLPAPQGQGFIRAADLVRMDLGDGASDFEKIKARQNVATRSLRLNAKLDFKPTQNLNITFGGSIDYNNRHDFVYEYALFNPVNNPQSINQTWRVYARLTQKFGGQVNPADEEKAASNIKNAFYTLQVGYTKVYNIQQDDTHKDRVFDYGYVGKFTQHKSRFFLPGNVVYQGDTVFGYQQVAFSDSLLEFEPGDKNPLMANYTELVYDYLGDQNIQNGDEVLANLGLLNGYRPSNIYSLWYNTGRQYNGYSKTDNSQFRIFTNFSADVKDHALQVGFEFEQRDERFWTVSPLDLWIRMRQLANYHLTQLDLANPILVPTGTVDAFIYNRYYDAASQRWFDKKLREKLGMAENSTDWIDVDSYDPEMYTLDMFSPDDLLLDGNNIVAYWGYDPYGNRLKSNPSFDDFFTKKDANGNFTRDIGAFRPIYMAGYIQDKFDFKDLKFNLGLRIDRFDANQLVLKDKYLLFEAATVGEVDGGVHNPYGEHPNNMGSDYVVYINDPSLKQIVGYRNGDRWYDAAGNELLDPKILATSTTSGQITPWLLDPSNKEVSSKAFKDYEPQLNFMPRIAFAFPISDEANFFAHYDVLTQRPTTGYRFDPTQYYYMSARQGSFINNPDLKPQRTTDYELGFTQTLSERKNSAITLSAFYREFRNLIQAINVNYAYPVNYLTFGNIDFGTTKGFTVAYDLRRTGGIQLTASYTLQFADGTGSGATTQVNLLNSGQPNLRNLIPLDFDQRHAIVTNVDYRFGSGSNYNGPVWKMKGREVRVLDNVGANVVMRAGSGVPYSRQFNVTQDAAFGIADRSTLKGSINGSRLPWQFRMDLRIDKNVDLKWGGKKDDGSDKKMANLNVYLQVLNVLNTKNIVSVYRYTGNAADDGYLTASQSQNTINAQTDPQSFIDLYTIAVNNPGNYSIPRRIRLGVMLDF